MIDLVSSIQGDSRPLGCVPASPCQGLFHNNDLLYIIPSFINRNQEGKENNTIVFHKTLLKMFESLMVY